MYIAWITTDENMQGASFATGKTFEECLQESRKQLPPIAARMQARGKVAAWVNITTGGGQRTVCSFQAF